MPLQTHDAEEEESYRALRSGNTHDAYGLADSLPHNGFGVVKSKALDVYGLFADSMDYTFRCCRCKTYKRGLVLIRADPNM